MQIFLLFIFADKNLSFATRFGLRKRRNGLKIRQDGVAKPRTKRITNFFMG
jgi:hypothetical protein